jgi:hypothetical protein
MKKLSLLFILCMLPMLALAQTDSAASPSNACSSGSGVFVNPASWNFPTIARHFSEQKQFVLCNNRSNNISITSIATAPSPLFAVLVVGTTCPDPGTVPANGQCAITVEFDPDASGNHLGTLTIGCNGAPACPITVPLSGTAEDDVTLTPRSFDFGSQPEGTTSPAHQFTVTNNEPIPLNITAIQTDPSAIFPVESGNGKCKTTQPVPAGSSCYVYVAFSPDEIGPASGYLQVETDSHDGTPPNATLSGTGLCNGQDCCPPEGCCPPPCCPPSSGKVSGDICPPTGALLPGGDLSPLPEGPLRAYLNPAPEAILNN